MYWILVLGSGIAMPRHFASAFRSSIPHNPYVGWNEDGSGNVRHCLACAFSDALAFLFLLLEGLRPGDSFGGIVERGKPRRSVRRLYCCCARGDRVNGCIDRKVKELARKTRSECSECGDRPDRC